MNLTKEQKHNLFLAWDYCDAEDKSTEFMLQYMVYNAKIEQDEVLQFLSETSEEMREDWYNDNTHLFCQRLTKLEDDGMRAVHFVQSGFRGEDGKPQWLYFVEDGVELEPYKSGIKRIDQTEMLEIYNKK